VPIPRDRGPFSTEADEGLLDRVLGDIWIPGYQAESLGQGFVLIHEEGFGRGEAVILGSDFAR